MNLVSETARLVKRGSMGKAASVTQIRLITAVLKLTLACFSVGLSLCLFLGPASCDLARGGLQLSVIQNRN